MTDKTIRSLCLGAIWAWVIAIAIGLGVVWADIYFNVGSRKIVWGDEIESALWLMVIIWPCWFGVFALLALEKMSPSKQTQ